MVWHTFICILWTTTVHRFAYTYTVLLCRPLSKTIKHQIVENGISGGRTGLRSEREERISLFILHIFILGDFFYNWHGNTLKLKTFNKQTNQEVLGCLKVLTDFFCFFVAKIRRDFSDNPIEAQVSKMLIKTDTTGSTPTWIS